MLRLTATRRWPIEIPVHRRTDIKVIHKPQSLHANQKVMLVLKRDVFCSIFILYFWRLLYLRYYRVIVLFIN